MQIAKSPSIQNIHKHDIEKFNHDFSSHCFIILHKNEPIDNIISILNLLPSNSSIIIVSNYTYSIKNILIVSLKNLRCTIYFIHQKDEIFTNYFKFNSVNILNEKQSIFDGKGEGMYLGAILASNIFHINKITFLDADNQKPSSLIDFINSSNSIFDIYNFNWDRFFIIRCIWKSKPYIDNLTKPKLGRCNSSISPIFDKLLLEWNYLEVNKNILCANSGEQSMNIYTLKNLKFSSGFSIETCQLLELFYYLFLEKRECYLIQYFSNEDFFHTKREDNHIDNMRNQSKSCFIKYDKYLTDEVMNLIKPTDIQVRYYPVIKDLPLLSSFVNISNYKING
jgi:mannosyl-3-phosphoglycerate synthase